MIFDGFFESVLKFDDKIDNKRSITSCKCSSVSCDLNLVLVNFIDKNNCSSA